MVVVHDTPFECALQMYEFSSKYLLQFQVIERTRFCDRQTDRQTQWEKQYVSHPSRGGGDIITAFNLHNYEMFK